MKTTKISVTLAYIASALFYVAAIIGFTGADNKSMPVVWLCLGSAMLCFGSAGLSKMKSGDGDDEKKE